MEINPDDSSYILKGSINEINSLLTLEKQRRVTDSLPKKNQESIFNKDNNNYLKTIYAIIFYIVLGIAIISVIIYLIFFFLIEKINSTLDDTKIVHTFKDNRIYQVIQLKNGIDVALISNYNSSINAMGLTFDNTNANDNNTKGLGNLFAQTVLKNLSLIGASEFLDVLTSHLGKIDVLYQDKLTSFSFELEKNGFADAMRVMSNFFKNYKGSSAAIATSLSDIQKDFERNHKNRDILEKQVLYRVIFNDEYGYFPQGNSETLKGIKNISDLLTNYKNSVFQGSKIKIALYSNLRINQMKGLAIKYLNDIVKEESSKKEEKNKVTSKKEFDLGKIILMNLDDSNYQYLSVSFYFDLNKIPQCDKYLKFIQYLFDDKAYNSTFKVLFDDSNIHELKTSINEYPSSLLEFKIQFETMNDTTGYDETYSVLCGLFTFLRKVKEASDEELETLYKDFEEINNRQFLYQPYPSDLVKYTRDISISLFNFSKTNLSEFTYGSNYVPPYDKDKIKEILDLFNYKNCIIVVGTDSSYKIGSIVNTLGNYNFRRGLEYYYRTDYFLANLNVEYMEEILKDPYFDSDIKLRKKNEYITQVTKTLNPLSSMSNTGTLGPEALFELRHLKLYHKLDVSFGIPKVCAYFNLLTVYTRPKNETKEERYSDTYLNLYQYYLMKYLIEEELSDAIDAGNKIEVSNTEKYFYIYFIFLVGM